MRFSGRGWIVPRSASALDIKTTNVKRLLEAYGVRGLAESADDKQ